MIKRRLIRRAEGDVYTDDEFRQKVETYRRKFADAVRNKLRDNEFLDIIEPIWRDPYYLDKNPADYMVTYRDRQDWLDDTFEQLGEHSNLVRIMREAMDEYDDDPTLLDNLKDSWDHAWEGRVICREQAEEMIDEANERFDEMIDVR